MPATRPILDLTPGEVVVLPTTVDGSTIGPLVVEWVQEDVDDTVCVGWHACREDHKLRLPLDLAARGALLLTRAATPLAPNAMHHAEWIAARRPTCPTARPPLPMIAAARASGPRRHRRLPQRGC